ncbi:hypothetical protein AB0G73_11405 [Streptomyces sp. NPDC020719]|uniref:hypothetical protein n=1 Tax=Streptomyces sp. NPDC020719 TaxID=3154896 RepID=UPI0033D44AED
MSTYTARRRVAVRAAIATAALAGTFLTPSAALAATPAGASSATAPDKCTAVATVPSVHAGMTVTLTNSLKQGPKAALKDGKGKVVATVDKVHPKDMEAGIAITGTGLAVPTFNQWLKGGEHATKNTPFPKMSDDCGKDLGGDTTYKLVNGETVTVHKSSRGHYRAEFLTNGHVVLILSTEGEGEEGVDGYVHGMHVALSATTGKLRSEFIHTRSGCDVTEVAHSVFGWGFSVKLTNGPAGWKAEQRDSNFKVLASADRAHPNAGLGMGLKITGGDTATPKLGQRTQGGDTPYQWSSFPAMPKGCTTTAKPTTSTDKTTTTAKTPTSALSADSAGQTTIVPKGAVAAGAEIKDQGGDDKTALYAGGTAATALGAAGFTLLRRRRMNRV